MNPCEGKAGRLNPHRCGKPSTTEIAGRVYCNLHAAVQRRMQSNLDKHRGKEAQHQQHITELTTRMHRAALRLNLENEDVALQTFGGGFVSEKVVMSLETFEELSKSQGS